MDMREHGHLKRAREQFMPEAFRASNEGEPKLLADVDIMQRG